MANVGYATLSVIPSLRGVQGRLTEQLGGPAAKAGDKAGNSAGGKMVGALGKVLKRGALAVGAAAGGVLSVSLFKGWQRLTQIENAQSKLQGLGHDAKSVQTIMDNALASVKGTAFGLGDAATVAASTVAAGIKPGKELQRVLGLVGDTATIAGSGLGEMGAIFNKVAASNRLSLGEVNQLADRGVPILQMIAKEYKVTQGEAAKMVSAGKVDFATFAKAIEDNIAGSALKSGETTQGAFANMKAAMGRFGASLLTGVFPIAKTVFGGATALLDKLTDRVKPLGAALGAFFLDLDGPVQSFIAGFTLSKDEAEELGGELEGLVATGVKVRDFVTSVTTKISQFVSGFKMTSAEVAAAGGPLEGFTKAGHRLKGMVDQVVRKLTGLADAAKESDSWDKIKDIFTKLKDAAILLAPAIGDIATSLGAASANIGVSTWDLLLTTVDLLASALLALAPTIQDLADWMKDHPAAVTALVGAYTLWKVSSIGITAALKVKAAWVAINTARVKALAAAQKVAAVAQRAWAAAVNAARYTQIAGYLAALRVKTVAQSTATKVAAGAQRAWNAALAGGRWVAAGAQIVALKVKTVALSAASKAAAVSQRLLNAAVSGGKWVAATAQMLAYKAASLAVSAATKVWSGIQAAFNLIMSMNPIGLIVIGIMLLVGAVILAYKKSDKFKAVVDAAFRAVGAAAKWLWEKAIKPAWEGIKKAFDVVAGVVTWWWKNIVTPAFNGVKAAFSALGSAFSAVWNKGIKPVFQALGGFIKDKIAPAFRTGVSAIGAAWDKVKAIASKPVEFIVETVLNKGIIGGINWLASKVGVKARIPEIKWGGVGGGTKPRGDKISGNTRGDGYGQGDGKGIGDGLGSLLAGPAKWLSSRLGLGKLAAKFGKNPFVATLTGAAGKAKDFALAKIQSLVGELFGGGGGSVGAGGLRSGIGGALAALRSVFGEVPLISGLRPGATTLTGNTSYHAAGRAVDIAPVRAWAEYLNRTFRGQLKELITPWPDLNLLNGRPHQYTGAVWRQHNFAGGNAHIHAAMDDGGVRVLRPGYNVVPNWTGKPEPIAGPNAMAAMLAGQNSGPEVLELTLDLGEGIREVVQINLREQNRQTKRRAVARGALAGAR